MKITKEHFGEMLSKKLREEFDTVSLSRWAYQLFIDHQRNIDPELRVLLLDLSRMEDGPEFEYSEKELVQLSMELKKGH